MDLKFEQLNDYHCLGISYKSADEIIRGKFIINQDDKTNLLKTAHLRGIKDVILLSTCNRTEIYARSENTQVLYQLIDKYVEGNVNTLKKLGYSYHGKEALYHLFKVGSGLESQILGDFEIIGQLKYSFKISKKMGMFSTFLERLINTVIHASKRIKRETNISSGITSVAFASAHYILKHTEDVSQLKIVLLGAGKIGRNTCENLIKHTPNKSIVLINRTKDKAKKIAGKFNLIHKDYTQLIPELANTDIVIVATSANRPTLNKGMLPKNKKLLVIDLSIPKNVDDDVKDLAQVNLIHLDELSNITDKTLEDRKKHIPNAHLILEEVFSEFTDWLETRKFAPTIHALKKQLTSIKKSEINFHRKKISDFQEEQVEKVTDRVVNKITSQFVHYLKNTNQPIDEKLHLFKSIFQLEIDEK